MDRYVVIGNPVEHSMSPVIHRHFAAATGEQLSYDRLLAPLDGFVPAIEQFFAAGGAGANVTVPFKEDAARWVDARDRQALAAGAVNTIAVEGRRRVGYNTDGIGLVQDLLVNLGWPLQDRRVLLLGAGGAARGAVAPLLEAGVAQVVIANRTVSRAQTLADQVAQAVGTSHLTVSSFERLAGPFDLVINATSAGLRQDVPAIAPALVAGVHCYDMIYGQATAFCDWCRASGALAVSDGIGMLVEQGAEAFRIWRGVRPPTAALLAELRLAREPRAC